VPHALSRCYHEHIALKIVSRYSISDNQRRQIFKQVLSWGDWRARVVARCLLRVGLIDESHTRQMFLRKILNCLAADKFVVRLYNRPQVNNAMLDGDMHNVLTLLVRTSEFLPMHAECPMVLFLFTLKSIQLLLYLLGLQFAISIILQYAQCAMTEVLQSHLKNYALVPYHRKNRYVN
jgi:hypothetical protein